MVVCGDVCCTGLLDAPCTGILFVGRTSGNANRGSSGVLSEVHLFAIVVPSVIQLDCARTRGTVLLGMPKEQDMGRWTSSTGLYSSLRQSIALRVMGATGDMFKAIGLAKSFIASEAYCGPLSLISTSGIPSLEKIERKTVIMLSGCCGAQLCDFWIV